MNYKFDKKKTISDLLSVGLHVSLLEVGGEPVEVLVVREEGVGLGAVEVSVPDAQQSQDHGNLKVNENTFWIIDYFWRL